MQVCVVSTVYDDGYAITTVTVTVRTDHMVPHCLDLLLRDENLLK